MLKEIQSTSQLVRASPLSPLTTSDFSSVLGLQTSALVDDLRIDLDVTHHILEVCDRYLLHLGLNEQLAPQRRSGHCWITLSYAQLSEPALHDEFHWVQPLEISKKRRTWEQG